ncbi:MAG: 16S rRNA (cytidine(1402)-2'-O)-methyltransferase [Actinomycetales bacterium]
MLVLAATPIGRPDDASPRLRHLLETADVIAAEDTRRLRRLAADLGIVLTGRVVSHHEHNEGRRTAELLDALRDGQTVLVVTDAGMPSVSDPGYVLVAAAVREGLPVTAAPGPSAVLTALALSALPVDRFCFEGFLPRKGGPRSTRLRELAAEPRTMVFFEAPHRLADSLADMAAALGDDRAAAVCRELTKTYEEVRRGPLAELVAWATDSDVRGEITIVVQGASPAETETNDAAVAARVRELLAAGVSRRDAAAQVASETGRRRREVYDLSLQDESE